MIVEYLSHGWDVNYNIQLDNQDIALLDKNPEHYLQVEKITDLKQGLKDRIFKFRVSAPDDDSDFELHYHPSGRSFDKIKSIHATMSPNLYNALKEKKEISAKHDHGLVSIVIR